MIPEERWSEDAVRALTLYKRVLGLIGVWPLRVSNARRHRSSTRWILAMLIQMSTIGSLSVEVYRHCDSPENTMDAFLMNVSSIVSLSKLILIGSQRRHTLNLIESVAKDWSTVMEPSQRKLMRRYTAKGRLVSLTILYLGYASGFSFVTMVLPFSRISINTTKLRDDAQGATYLLATQCAFGTPSAAVHGCLLALQALQIFVNATCHCGNDGFFFGLTMHLCGQFEILKGEFANLGPDGIASCRVRLRTLVQRHCRLARLTESLEEAFNLAILIQVLMSSFLLCVEGFQLISSIKSKESLASVKHAVLIATLLAQLYIYAIAGENLERRTAGIALAAYNCPWYQFNAKFTRDLSLVVLYGSIPRRVTAGKYLPMNLFTLKEILKASASYLSVLRVMIEA